MTVRRAMLRSIATFRGREGGWTATRNVGLAGCHVGLGAQQDFCAAVVRRVKPGQVGWRDNHVVDLVIGDSAEQLTQTSTRACARRRLRAWRSPSMIYTSSAGAEYWAPQAVP